MKVRLGRLVRALEGWVVCIGECGSECTFCIHLPEWAEKLKEKERILLTLYLVARATMDYRVVAVAHLYSLEHRVTLRPELYIRAWKESKVQSRIPPRIDDNSAWETTLYRGLLYAQTIKTTRAKTTSS